MKIRFYEDRRGEWRWQITAKNGKIIAASSEGFKKKSSSINNLNLL